jgi:Ser/Thr protein kinase RdoA (MazF antagonist)
VNAFAQMTTDEQIASLGDCVREVLDQYGLGEYEFESINHEYNSTFRVTASDGQRYALRINVNSKRSLANLNAEVFWVDSISDVQVPKPKPNRDGALSTTGWHEASGRTLHAVLYSWLEGEEVGDEPQPDQLHAAGAAMARLHLGAKDLVLPTDAQLPDLSDFFWGWPDNLLIDSSPLTAEEKQTVLEVKNLVDQLLHELAASSSARPIHADIHPWNLMWHNGEVAVFDFDDSGIGLPIQDLATSLYYLDTDEQEQAFMDGYASVAPLPEHSPRQMQLLKLQRRIQLLTFLNESTTPGHSEMIPKYQAETFRRITEALS